jgi:hypothetical protein
LKAIVLACAMLGVIALPHPARAEGNASSGIEILPILQGPVQVDAVIVDTVTDGVFNWSQQAYDSTYRINDGHTVQIVKTVLFSALAGNRSTDFSFIDRAAVLSLAQSEVKWQSPYLLVSSIWDWKKAEQNNIVLFKLEAGRVERFANLSGGEEQFPQEGRFFSRFPSTWMRFTCMAVSYGCAADWQVALDDRNDTLTVNGLETWQKNQRLWQAYDQFIHAELAQIAMHRDDNIRDWGDPYDSHHGNVFGTILQNAVLAKYCRRDTELNALLQFARPYLDDKHRQNLDDILAQVTPLESFPDWNLH